MKQTQEQEREPSKNNLEGSLRESVLIKHNGENSCPEKDCEGYLVYREGCRSCFVCGYSKC